MRGSGVQVTQAAPLQTLDFFRVFLYFKGVFERRFELPVHTCLCRFVLLFFLRCVQSVYKGIQKKLVKGFE